MKIRLIFAWYDFWIGFYWNKKGQILYFFPIPMIGIKLCFRVKKKKDLPSIDDVLGILKDDSEKVVQPVLVTKVLKLRWVKDINDA